MSDANKMTVTYDPAFHDRPGLCEQVVKAHSFFAQRYKSAEGAADSPPVRIEWKFDPDSYLPLSVVLHERDARGERSVEWMMSRTALADEVSRNVNMIRFWGKILEARSREHMSFTEMAIRRAESLLLEAAHE